MRRRWQLRPKTLTGWGLILLAVIDRLISRAGDAQTIASGWTWLDKQVDFPNVGNILADWYWLALLIGGLLFVYFGNRPRPDAPSLQVSEEVKAADSAEVKKIDPQVFFYEGRHKLNEFRFGGIQGELETVGQAWLATHTGIHTSGVNLYRAGKLKRLLLLKPVDDGYLKEFATGVLDRTLDELISSIKETTRIAQGAGTEVRWIDGPIMAAIYGNPHSDTGWIRVEPFTPFYNDRMNFLIEGHVYTTLYKNLLQAFEGQWSKAKAASDADLLPSQAAKIAASMEKKYTVSDPYYTLAALFYEMSQELAAGMDDDDFGAIERRLHTGKMLWPDYMAEFAIQGLIDIDDSAARTRAGRRYKMTELGRAVVFHLRDHPPMPPARVFEPQPDVVARRQAIKETLRSHQDDIWQSIEIPDYEMAGRMIVNLGRFIEDKLGMPEAQRFRNDDGLTDLGQTERRLRRLQELLDRINEIDLPDS